MDQGTTVDDVLAKDLVELDANLETILPEEYQECYEGVEPISMGSAGLKYDSSGRVAWDEIWGSFCDLAMAGGPPHRGTLLEPASAAEIQSDPERYGIAADEICRGIRMVSDLAVDRSPDAGWVNLFCTNVGMAGWMARAIVMENVSARADGSVVRLPAGPQFRLEKEIKNVVTSVAKTAHYFVDHIWSGQQRAIAELFEKAETEAPLLQPALPKQAAEEEAIRALCLQAAERICQVTGLGSHGREYQGWLGLDCLSVRTAIWMMRALAVKNSLARREETVLYVPVNPKLDPAGARVVFAVSEVWKLAVRKGDVVTT
jgi:hypothetical protein